MPGGSRPLTEWAVLGLLAEGPAHPFALAKHVEGDGPLGRVFQVRRSQVYRAMERLVEAGLAVPDRVEHGASGPDRTVFRITGRGRRSLEDWLARPVEHIRELRLGFLLRLELLRRAGGDASALIAAQREALRPTLEALIALPADPDPIDRWRHHNAAAVFSFLDALADDHR